MSSFMICIPSWLAINYPSSFVTRPSNSQSKECPGNHNHCKFCFPWMLKTSYYIRYIRNDNDDESCSIFYDEMTKGKSFMMYVYSNHKEDHL